MAARRPLVQHQASFEEAYFALLLGRDWPPVERCRGCATLRDRYLETGRPFDAEAVTEGAILSLP